MKKKYKIEINLFKENKQFFWCLRSYVGKNWCMENAGWEDTPIKAWKEAFDFYQNLKKCEN